MKRTLLLISLVFIALTSYAQKTVVSGAPIPPSIFLPIDPEVRHGVLENGMTYYIRKNDQPENRADFYLAQKVGSMQEEDNQAGLAHFLEHMAFNGTKHFQGRKTMLNYLETLGANFGRNVNAHTGFDETVYKLSSIPMHRETIIDSCLLILHDWSGYISLENEEIDKERLIIKEEWRTRDNAMTRIWDKQLAVLFEGSKYANRMPIGTMEVVENFEYQVLKDYYHKWYRPDLQAVIAVGDFDLDLVEKKIKNLFSTIPMPDNAAERIYYEVPDNKVPLITIITDKESTNERVDLMLKHDIVPEHIKKTEQGYQLNLLKILSVSILAERLNEISTTESSPFGIAVAFDNKFFVSSTKDAWSLIGISKENKSAETLAVLIQENERVRRFGFTHSELERAKANLIQDYEAAYNNRDKQNSSVYREEYVRSFLDNEPIPGIEFEYKYVQGFMPYLSVDVLNQFIQQYIPKENIAIAISGPEKEAAIYPTVSEVLDIYNTGLLAELEPKKEEMLAENLVSEKPVRTTIVKEEDGVFDSKLWTLSNGMKVVYKETSFKDDELLMNSFGYGGKSLVEDEDILNAGMLGMVKAIGGLGDFSAVDLEKMLAGKKANSYLQVGDFGQSIGGSSSMKDAESMFEQTYLIFTSPRKDQSVYQARMGFIKEQLKARELNPSAVFSDSINMTTYPNNIRYKTLKHTDVDKLDYDKIISIHRDVLANPSSMVFVFVGSMEAENLKPLLETYLATLPAGDKDAKYTERNNIPQRGIVENIFKHKMETAKASSYAMYSGIIDRNLKNETYLDALKQVLEMVYIRTVREEVGGTYGVGVGSRMNRVPEGLVTILMSYDSNPDEIDNVGPIIDQEIRRIAETGPEAEDFQKVREYMIKKNQELAETNRYWSGVLLTKYFYDEDEHTDYQSIVSSMKPSDIQSLAKVILDQENMLKVVMLPQEE